MPSSKQRSLRAVAAVWMTGTALTVIAVTLPHHPANAQFASGGAGSGNGGAGGNGGATPTAGLSGSGAGGGSGGAAGSSGSPDGGAGGFSAGGGGGGGGGGFSPTFTGDINVTPTAGNGGVGNVSATGGGGGGGGGDGAVINAPSSVTISAGITGGNGGIGGLGGGATGGGGGGGAGVISLTANGLIINANVTGGAGGFSTTGGAGGGGAGVVLQNGGSAQVNATVTGGVGGASGGLPAGNSGAGIVGNASAQVTVATAGQVVGGTAIGLGSGGAGVNLFAGGMVTNAGTISGGNSDNASTAGVTVVQGGTGNGGATGLPSNFPIQSQGGFGIRGANITVVNSGTISGGSNSVTRANAIEFAGGSNTLTLQTGSTINGNIGVTGSLTFNQATAQTLSNVISGTGNVINNGTGALNLTGTSTYTGTTTVNGGTLAVNGNTASSVLTTVNAGGTLGGTGTVGNTTIAGGTLAPGNSIGTLTVQGNLVLTAAATYLVEVSPTAADRTNVTGTAALGNATVNAVFGPGSYVARQYTVLNAAGGRTGTFGTLVNTGLPANFASSLSYDANNAYLNLTLNLPTGGGGGGGAPAFSPLNINQTNVGNALVNYFNTTGGIPAVYGTLTAAGLTQASGEIATATQQPTYDAMNLFVGVMTDPFTAGRGGNASASSGATAFADDAVLGYAAKRKTADAFAAIYRKAPVAAPFVERWSVWAAGYGGSQTTDGQPAVGSNNTTSSVYGATVGADYRFSPDTIAGFALAGGGTNFRVTNSGTGRSDLFQAGGFIRHNMDAAYITAAAAYGWQDVTTDRNVTIAGFDQLRARFTSNALTGRIESGYRFVSPFAGGIGVTPYAAGQVTTIFLPSYGETVIAGANTFALAYASRDVTATRSELGLRTDKSFVMQTAILTLRGRAAWTHNFNPDRSINATFQSLPGASFTVNGAAASRDTALTSASAELRWMNGWSIAGTFEGEFSDRSRSYAGKGVARYVW